MERGATTAKATKLLVADWQIGAVQQWWWQHCSVINSPSLFELSCHSQSPPIPCLPFRPSVLTLLTFSVSPSFAVLFWLSLSTLYLPLHPLPSFVDDPPYWFQGKRKVIWIVLIYLYVRTPTSTSCSAINGGGQQALQIGLSSCNLGPALY